MRTNWNNNRKLGTTLPHGADMMFYACDHAVFGGMIANLQVFLRKNKRLIGANTIQASQYSCQPAVKILSTTVEAIWRYMSKRKCRRGGTHFISERDIWLLSLKLLSMPCNLLRLWTHCFTFVSNAVSMDLEYPWIHMAAFQELRRNYNKKWLLKVILHQNVVSETILTSTFECCSAMLHFVTVFHSTTKVGDVVTWWHHLVKILKIPRSHFLGIKQKILHAGSAEVVCYALHGLPWYLMSL